MENKIELIIITLSFPYDIGNEKTFLQHEIVALSKKFESLTIMPSTIGGEKQKLPGNVKLNEDFAKYLQNYGHPDKIKALAINLTSSLFFKELIENPSIIFRFQKLKKIIYFLSLSLLVKKYFKRYIAEKSLFNSNVVFYTYWFCYVTTGIGVAIQKYKNMKLITRAHGIDLYEDRNDGYIPYRKQSIKLLERFFFISQHGKNYILNKYPEFKSKYKIARLGVKDPGLRATMSKDNIFRVISCSGLIPIKKVDLLFSGLIEHGNKHPERIIEWIHIGDGPLKKELLYKVKKDSPINLKCRFLGFQPSKKVYEFYNTNPVDVFINVSSTEGLPVTLMEAQSFSIPVIGTDVGGVSEIINEKVGKLLSSNPTPIEISDALEFFMSNPSEIKVKRQNSRKNWELNFNAYINFKRFAEEIAEL